MMSLASPDRRLLRVDLYPRTNFPLFITNDSLLLRLSAPVFFTINLLNINQYQIIMNQQDIDFFYSTFIWSRRIELFFASICLSYMIVDIIGKRIYVYNSIRLFFFMCLFYLLAMLTLLVHVEYISNGKTFQYQQLNSTQKALCGSEAFISFFCYNMAYFFAVLITLHMLRVINNTHRKFMLSIFTNIKVLLCLVIMFVLYLLPFIFIFEESPLYYYPTGFKLDGELFLLYCGVNPLLEEGKWILIIMVTIVPFILFILHFVLIIMVEIKKRKFKNLSILNSRQKFILSSSSLSLVAFVFHAVNLGKSLLVIDSGIDEGFIISLNYLFNFYPFVLFFFYCKDINLGERKRLLQESQYRY